MINGEKIKEIFPNIDNRLDEKTGIMIVKWADNTTKFFKTNWWNAEYKEPTAKNNLGVDCISRADSIKAMEDKAKKLTNEDTINGLCGAVAILFDLPSVTPQEPRKGHWISTETKGVRYAFWCRYKCSLCGELSNHTNFCPNCGANMREVEE